MSALLVVSPDETRLRLMEAALKETGFVVTTAGTTELAIQIVRDGRPDAVVADVTPGTEGALHLIHSIRNDGDGRLSGLPLVVSAGRDLDDDRVAAWEAGCDAWLPRPHHMREVAEVLGELLPLAPRKRIKRRQQHLEAAYARAAERRRRD